MLTIESKNFAVTGKKSSFVFYVYSAKKEVRSYQLSPAYSKNSTNSDVNFQQSY